MNIFGMVTTRHSNNYTNYAVPSLIENTKLQADDEVILIDNDAAYGGLPEECRSRVKLIVNEKPRSFAANLNQTMELARPRQANVVFLNNDMVFSHGWFEPLRPEGQFLVSPLSNAELPYEEGGLKCGLGMDLEDYLGKEDIFRDIVRKHRNKVRGYMHVLSCPFFAIKIPYSVYSVVGPLDESYGVGGGEDKDYCIRCYQHGFEVRFALNSYILHFQGKSTWRGAETREQTAARDRFYSERFREKWGEALYEVLVMHNLKGLPQDLQQAYKDSQFRKVVESLLPRGA